MIEGRDIYARDARVRKAALEKLDGLFERAQRYYERALASLVGMKAFRDWTPTERWATYERNPPVVLDLSIFVTLTDEEQALALQSLLQTNPNLLMPPPDVDGVLPYWNAIASEHQGYFMWILRDYLSLARQQRRKSSQPARNGNGAAALY